MLENRGEERRLVIRPVYFSGIVTGAYTALTLDSSSSGLCVLTDLNVAPGQNVTLVSRSLWSEPVSAVAVWKSGDMVDGYRVGFRIC